MLLNTMQDVELRVSRIIDHAAREHAGREIVTRWADGSESRTTWAGIAHDAKRLAQALDRLGMQPGDRIATLAMNHAHHLVAWYGAMGMGGIVHTINPRLFDDQLVYIANHAEDRVLLYDRAFAAVVDRLRPRLTTIEHYVLMDGEGPSTLAALLAPEDGAYTWVEGSEREPCMLAYTSGTTGDPKGVLYTHRSSTLHALTVITPAIFNLSSRDTVLPVVPMFHAAGWGLPLAVPIAGARFVFSAVNDPAILCDLMNREKVTHSAGVPTVWLGTFAHIDAGNPPPRYLKLASIGGSAAPRAMIERLMGMGIDVSHLWGMTETSPVGTAGQRPTEWDGMGLDARLDLVSKQGQIPFGIELRVVDEEGREQPRDGVSSGRLQVRGPWVVRRYYGASEDALDADGWFDTGDVAVLHPDGTMQITDRAKDVIKSGGEWISSVDLENAAVGCPGVAEAAAIAMPHPKWDERPLLVVVRKPDSDVTAAAIQTHLAAQVAKWWLPDEIVFVDSLPHTATGKLLKTALRERFRGHVSATARREDSEK
jgi:fatty-acyl-CoA synthase